MRTTQWIAPTFRSGDGKRQQVALAEDLRLVELLRAEVGQLEFGELDFAVQNLK